VPRTPHNSEALSEVLARQFPNLSRDAIDRIKSGKSLFVSRHKLRPELPDRDYARLVVMRAMGVFSKITGLPSSRLILTEDEKELLIPVIEPERPVSPSRRTSG
jgi:hypothetical protein